MPESRRDFLRLLARLGITAAAGKFFLSEGGLAERCLAAAGPRALKPVEAEFYEKLDGGKVRCLLCPHEENLAPGQAGKCRCRANIDGKLMTWAAGQPCVINVDPIEKSPLAHVLPGRKVLAVAHAGCNVECLYCQNWQMALRSPKETTNLEFSRPSALADATKQDLAGLTFTYTEPTTALEFNRDLAAAAQKQGLRSFLCTNGYVSAKPFDGLLANLDGVTVTLKGFTDGFYQQYVRIGSMEPVLETLKRIKAAGKWLEVATLVVPGANDNDADLKKLIAWIRTNLGPDTPWHLERFAPSYKMANLPPTPIPTLEHVRQLGFAGGLRYVYLANVPLHEGNHTYCAACKKPLIKRAGFKVIENNLKSGRCGFCKAAIPGVWS
jgi:pyruvate formate lyase activating enzyme